MTKVDFDIKNILYFCHATHYGCMFVLCAVFLFSCGIKSAVPSDNEKNQEMVMVPSGVHVLGENGAEVEIPSFWLQKYEVTQALFAAFVNATGYKTLAEKNGGSYIFVPEKNTDDSLSIKGAPWWHFRRGTSWKSALGDSISMKKKPVTHIAYEDACAYCKWLGMRLPYEAEWEYAAKKNGEQEQMNIWQGVFPNQNLLTDGFAETSPVGHFGMGKLGLADMGGNVWEWCADYYHADWYAQAASFSSDERFRGPSRPYTPTEPYTEMRVIRGGSYLCSDNYCTGYRSNTRMYSDVRTTFGHIGFRCAKNAE